MSQQLSLSHRTAPANSVRKAQRARPHHKSRTGCVTCKARRVKCDEGKPVCRRCRSTGRTCDGYGIMGGGGNTYLERYGVLKVVPSSPTTIKNPLVKVSTHHELRYLELYKQRVVHTSSGWFGAGFWRFIVLPAASSEPAIMHAVIALSAAHRCNLDPSQDADARERFVVQQYNNAIRSLQPLLRHHDKASIAVVLVACQIFTFLEYIRGRYGSAATHLQSGLRLLKDAIRESDVAPRKTITLESSSCPKGIEKGIIRSFATLQMQAALFGSNPDQTSDYLDSVDNVIPYPTFTSIEEAKDSLDILLHRTTLLSQLAKNPGTWSKNKHDAISVAKHQLHNHFATWYSTYQRTVPLINSRIQALHRTPNKPLAFGTRSSPSSIPNTREPLAYTLLLMHHAMGSIMCKSILYPSEKAYMAHTCSFLAVLTHAITIYQAYTLAASIPDNVNLHDSVSEYGYIAPLYYTAIKCRVRRIRRHAICLLRTIPHKEGVWDALVVADVSERVMWVEEDGLEGWGDGGEFGMGDVPVLGEEDFEGVPEEGLVREVRVEMRDEGEGVRAAVRCKRGMGDVGCEVEDLVFCV